MQPKIAAAGLGGALATIVVWVFQLAGVEVPPEVAAAFTALLSTLAGWLKPA